MFRLFSPFHPFAIFRVPSGGEYVPPDPGETPDGALLTADGEYVMTAEGEYVVVSA